MADSIKAVALTSAGFNTSYSVTLEKGSALLTVENATSDLVFKMQRLNVHSKNWVDITDNDGTLTTRSKNGTYTINNASKPTEYRIVVTAGGGTFTVEQ